VPRKTPADKARNSSRYYREAVKAAYTSGDIDAPLTQAMRWLYAALTQRARETPAEAEGLYRHATEQIAAYAESVQHRTAAKAGK